MNKASSAFLASAGVTVGLLGFALPAGVSVSDGPAPGQPPVQSQPNQPSGPQNTNPGGPQSSNNRNGGDNRNGGNEDSGSKRGGDQPTPYPTRTRNPCPPRTKTPCPPKPCEPVVHKPCKPHRDKDGHLTSYRQTPKHVLVCKPKPCPTKPKPCPPKCKKHQPHKHPCHKPAYRGGVKGPGMSYIPGVS